MLLGMSQWVLFHDAHHITVTNTWLDKTAPPLQLPDQNSTCVVVDTHLEQRSQLLQMVEEATQGVGAEEMLVDDDMAPTPSNYSNATTQNHNEKVLHPAQVDWVSN